MSKTGYFEHWEREHLGENSKQSIFSKTIESYNKSIEQGNYSLGFLISSSLLEDRIKSLWVLVEWKQRMKSLFPTKENIGLMDTIPITEVEVQPIEMSVHLDSEKVVYRIKPTPSDVSKVPIEKMLEDIKDYGAISNNSKKSTLFLLEIRNILTNLSMWNQDRYTEENCKKFYQEFRFYDKIVRQVKLT